MSYGMYRQVFEITTEILKTVQRVEHMTQEILQEIVQAKIQPTRQDEEAEIKRCRIWASTNGLTNVAAIRSIGYAKISSFEDINEEVFLDVRLCGKKTTKIIMDWAASKKENKL